MTKRRKITPDPKRRNYSINSRHILANVEYNLEKDQQDLESLQTFDRNSFTTEKVSIIHAKTKDENLT